jgi:hypothetical protein
MALPMTRECSNVAAAGFPVLSQGKQDSNRGFPVDSSQFGP